MVLKKISLTEHYYLQGNCIWRRNLAVSDELI